MRILKIIFLVTGIILLSSCRETKEKKKKFSYDRKHNSSSNLKEVNDNNNNFIKASETIDLINKGFGPVKDIDLSEEINPSMAYRGSELFKKYCTSCHKIGKKFIGPPPNKILKRRTPEWVMNMIINPEQMIKKDPLAKKLLIEFNGAPMANQNISEEQARSLLEYFRTLN